MAKTLTTVRFPNESPEYRTRRDALLEAERGLRAQIEQVAEMRRQLPLGGTLPEDYVFEEGPADIAGTGPARPVRLSELFREGTDTLVLYSFMYGPNMKQACSSCTSMLDSLNGAAPHIQQRVNLAVVAKSPLDRIRQFARGRGWDNLRLLSAAHNTYTADYHGETVEGNQMPALNVFARRDGHIHHTYCTELLYAPFERGQDGRHIDLIWPLWNVFDMTPDGRGTTWNPRLTYEPLPAGK
jgi:predicted dithiol-disulfide oxidoreductase (DUF899 family)